MDDDLDDDNQLLGGRNLLRRPRLDEHDSTSLGQRALWVRAQDAGQIQIQIQSIRNRMFRNPNTRCVRKKQGDAPLIIAIIFILLTPAAFYGGAWYFGKV